MCRFGEALTRACELAKARQKTNPNDGEALFALTLAAGMESDAESILQKKHMDALKRIKEANKYAEWLRHGFRTRATLTSLLVSPITLATIGASDGVATGVAAGTTSITASQGGAGSPVAIAIGRLNTNTDSTPDSVIASQINNSVMVLLGNGDGTFSNPKTAVTYAVGNQPTGIVLGTFSHVFHVAVRIRSGGGVSHRRSVGNG
jgi:hypothetical protein